MTLQRVVSRRGLRTFHAVADRVYRRDPRWVPPVRQQVRRWWRLTFTAAGLACHPLSQLVDCPVTRERIADRLGTDPLSVLHLARVGLPAEPPARSGRRR